MHDINGASLQVGDRVLVEMQVTAVGGDTEYCNVTVETVRPMPGNGLKNSLVLNTKQVGVAMRSPDQECPK